MNFVDEVVISTAGGRGGNGCMSFRREKFLPNGGPDGGNGGRGGDVILRAMANSHSLADFERRRRYAAENGEHGKGNAKNGRAGKSLELAVPCGTIVLDAETGEGLADLVEPGDTYVAAMGGRGGRGNRAFASSRRRAPRFSEKGEIGDSNVIALELKLIADIGLVGMPNAGKSSLLAALSNAAPKVADYPFTTLSPNLGVLRTDIENVVIADIPGIIEGASEDKGLGLKFLRHIERTRLLVHLLDTSSGDIDAIKSDWKTIRDELSSYDQELSKRPCIVVGNKIDVCGSDAELYVELEKYFNDIGLSYISVSALTGENIPALADTIVEFSASHPRPHGAARLYASTVEREDITLPQRRSRRMQIQIVPLPDGSFRVLHPQIEKAAERYDLSQDENVARFTKLLRKYRVEELLSAAGASFGDQVSIGRMDFDFSPDSFPSDRDDDDDSEDGEEA